MPIVIGLGDTAWNDPLNIYGGKPTAAEPPKANTPASSGGRKFTLTDQDRQDLRKTIAAEAAGEGETGMIAVGNVIRNRAERRGKGLADVVREPKQFTGYEAPGEGALQILQDPDQLAKIDSIIDRMASGELPDVTGGADHYHADYVSPDWGGKMPKTTQVGSHLFYRAETGPDTRKKADQIGLGEDPFAAVLAGETAPTEKAVVSSVLDAAPTDGKATAKSAAKSADISVAGKTPIDIASTLLGKGEVPDRETLQEFFKNGGQNLDPATTAWCAAFVNSALGAAGIQGTGKLNARSFLDWGEPVDTPQRGDIAVFTRGGKNSWKGHVAFFDSVNPDGTINVLGGNQGDQVSLKAYSADRLLGYRRPPSGSTQIKGNTIVLDESFTASDPMGLLGEGSAFSGFTRKTTPAESAIDGQMSPTGASPAAGSTEATAAGGVVIDEGFAASDPMGLLAGGNPFAGIVEEAKAKRVAEETQVADQFEQNRITGLTQVANRETEVRRAELEAESPGRYVEMPAEEVPEFQRQWEEENRSGGVLGDTSRILKSGVIGVGQSLTSLADTIFSNIPGGEAFLKASDEIDRWAMGQTLDQRMDTAKAKTNASVTKEQAEADTKNWWDSENGRFGPAWSDPRSYLRTVGESVPATVVTMAPGGIMARGAYLRTLAATGSERAAAAAAARTATVAGALLEGTMGGADTARAVRDRIDAIPRDQLLQTETVRALVDGGMSEDQALTALTTDASTKAFAIAGVATGMFGGMGDRTLAKILAEGVGGNIAQRMLAGGARGMIAEGLLEEAPQGAAQTIAENIGVRDAKPDQELTEGMGEAVASGIAGGGVMGGGMGAAGGAASRQTATGASDPVSAPDVPEMAAPAPAPRGPIGRAVQHAEQQITQRQAAAAPADVIPSPAGVTDSLTDDPAASPSPAPAQDGRPQVGATVRIDADGVEPFMGRVDGYEGDDAVVIDGASGEVYQIPIGNLTEIAKPMQANVDRGPQPVNDTIPEFSSDPALEPMPPAAAEVRSEGLPPRSEQKAATERFPSAPTAGQRVIVDDENGGRFAATVQRYEGDGTEALIRTDDGKDLQVPVSSLKVSKLTEKQVEAQELERNPPIEREVADAGPTSRSVLGKTIVMPDDKHARLFDLGKMRQSSRRTIGTSQLDLDRVDPRELKALATEFGIPEQAIGQLADDYATRMVRNVRSANSKLPQRMPPVMDSIIARWRREVVDADTSPAADETQSWYDRELDDEGRRLAMISANIKRPPKTPWVDLSPAMQRKLATVREEQLAAAAAETAVDSTEANSVESEASDEAPVIGFTTAKGSTYQVDEQGRTTRNKAKRDDPGHEGDSGMKPKTARTIYVDTDASVLSAAGLSGLGSKGARVVIKDGKASLATWNEKENRWGVSPGSRDIPFSETPKVGAYPLELWNRNDDIPGYEGYSGMHAGNAIVSVERAPEASGKVAEAQRPDADTPIPDGQPTITRDPPPAMEPLEVYHGTYGDFERFDPTFLGKETEAGSAREAFFFSSDARVSAGYAASYNPYKDGPLAKFLPGRLGDIYQRFNEFLLRLFGAKSQIEAAGTVLRIRLRLENPMIFDAEGRELSDKERVEQIAKAKRDGHDAVVFRNSRDPGYTDDSDVVSDVVAVFDPERIDILSKHSTEEAAKAARLTVAEGQPVKTVDEAANEAATSPTNDLPEPTPAQKEAGNYKVGRISLGGLDISIENPAGSERKGTDADGKAWSVTMKSHYGYIRGTVGRDKDHIDVFVKPGTEALQTGSPVFVIDQENRDGSFDEHKVMLGFDTQKEAERAYLANYTKGWKLGPVSETTLGEFKTWLSDGETSERFATAANDSAERTINGKRLAFPDKYHAAVFDLGVKLLDANGVAADKVVAGTSIDTVVPETVDLTDTQRAEAERLVSTIGSYMDPVVSSADEMAIAAMEIAAMELEVAASKKGKGEVQASSVIDVEAQQEWAQAVIDEMSKGVPVKARAAMATEAAPAAAGPALAFSADEQPAAATLEPNANKRDDPDPIMPTDPKFRRLPVPDRPASTSLFTWAKEAVLERGRRTGNEHIIAIDDDGSVVEFGTSDKPKFVGLNARLSKAVANPDRRLVFIHNHPKNWPLSVGDVAMLANPGAYSVWALGHDGRETRASLTERAQNAVRLGASPDDVINSIKRFDKALRDSEKGLEVLIGGKLADGTITIEQAEEAHFNAILESARRAGVIDFTTNQPYDLSNIPMLDRAIDNAALKLARTLLDERATPQTSDAGVLRQTVGVQHVGELGAVAGDRPDVEGRNQGQRGLSEGSARDYQSEAQGRNARRLSGSRRISENSIIEAINGKWTDLNPSVLATVPLNYFVELARPNMTAVKEYMSVKRLMDAYRGDKHAEADAIAGDWLKYMRLGFGKTNKAKAQELADLMHDSTLAGIDPSLTDDETKAKAGYDILRKRYQALPASGKELFGKVRDAYRAQADELDQILLDNVRKSQQIAKDQAEARYKKKLEEIRDAKMNPIDRRKAEEDAASRFKAESTKMDWSAKARLTKLRIQFESNRVPAPYFPLGRFGQYFVTAKDVDGSVISFSKFERAADRDRFAREIQRDYPGATVTKGVMKDMTDPRAAMDPRMVAEIEQLLGNAGVDQDLMDMVYQRYLETLPELSMRKRYMHRKGTAGFDTDALRVFSSHMFHAAHQMAKLKYGLELQELVNTTFDQAEAADDQTRAMRLANEMASRHKWVMNPTGGSVAQTMTSTAFVWFLAASPAAAVLNLTQTLMMGLPILGTRFGGIGRASVEVAKSSADLISGKGSVRNANLSREEAAAVDAFYRSGMIDRTQSHDLAGVGDTGVKYSPLRSRVMAVMSWAFHNTEVWNRETTALAAYRLARKAGQSHLDAIDSAHDLTWKTHFDYSNSSRPRIMQNDFAKVALVFRSYSINMLYRMFRDVHQSVKGESPQARREARYQLAGVTGMMALMAGVTGTFGFNLMMGVAGLVFGDDDDPMDFEERFKADVIDILGPELGGVLLKGVPGHYMGVDLTSRIGMPDLWFRSPGQDLQGKEEWNYWVSQILGATAGIGEQWFRGASLIMEGDVARGVEVAAPKFIRDPMKAFRYTNEGLQSIRGDELLPAEEIGIHGAVAQAMGVSPAIVSETWERSGALKNAEKRVMDERQRVVNAWAMAALAGDKEGVAEAIERVKAFNKKPVHSAIPITQDTLKRSIKTRVRNAAKREDGVLIQNEILSQRLRAAMPERLY